MYSLKDYNIDVRDFKELISNEDIYQYYLGDFTDGSVFSTPWRKDNNPSLRISYYKGEWVWVDYGTDIRPKDGINFIQKYYNVDFQTALKMGYDDIISGGYKRSLPRQYKDKENISFCRIRDLNQSELLYWNKANILKSRLNYFNIYSGEIRHNGLMWHESVIDDPLFIYMWDKDVPIYKGYRPYAPTQSLKFYSKNIKDHIQGYDLIPNKGDILIITKSYKDVVVWDHLGYPAISPHTEVTFLSEQQVIELKKRYNRIIINYDNDFTGIEKSIQFSKQYNLETFILPTSTGSKDPFQLVTTQSYNILNQLFIKKLKNEI